MPLPSIISKCKKPLGCTFLLTKLLHSTEPFVFPKSFFLHIPPPPPKATIGGGISTGQLGQGWGRAYHDGRPRGPLWRGKKLIGKEALFVISGLKRFKDESEKLEKFIKTHVLRLLKLDMIAVLNELERQQEVSLAVKVIDY